MDRTEFNQTATDGVEEQLHDTLIAISVVAKRLATKLAEEMKTEGDKPCTEDTD